MGIGVGIFLIAIGAVLTFAVHVSTTGIDLHTVGIILMAAGGFGVVLSLVFWSTWGGPNAWRRDGTTVVDTRTTPVVDSRGTPIDSRPI
jgi:hypothetical protein